jgi:tetratricopeptide (TPR) repeat protein
MLDRLVRMTFIALILVVVGFGAYYYWDRYIHLGDESPVEKGAAYLEEQVRENPNDPAVRIALAHFYLQSGAYERSIEQANQILSAMPEDQNGLFFLGMSYAYLKQPEEAIEPLSKFVIIREQGEMAGLDSELQRALYFLGDSYFKTGRPDEAVASLTRALEINRTDADAMYVLGQVYASLGKHAQALEQYQNAVRFVPDFTEAYQGMLESYSALDHSSYVAYAKGMEALTMDDLETALTYLESAADGLSDFAPAYLGLGLTYEKLGNAQQATMNLQRALELDPDNYMASHALGRIQAASLSVDG